jgi:uncharacterized SAM-binding protein YcdF (DUF218 family)
MFFVLSKVLQFLIYTIPLFFLALIGILIFYHWKPSRKCLLILLVVFYILSIPFTAQRLMKWLEGPRLSFDQLKKRYDVAVVLTGMVSLQLSGKDHIEFNSHVDRILAGISLVRQGITDKLLVSGGSGSLFDQSLREAELLKKFMMEFGLTGDQILVDPTSRNTYENAVNSANLIRANNYQTIVLITSASHMRRAVATFHKQGIFPDTYPVDFFATEVIDPFSFVPSADSLSMIDSVMHELIGLIMYRVYGYI